MLIYLFRLIFYFLVAYVFIKLIRFFLNPAASRRKVNPPPPKQGLMVKDEACNTYLPKEDAIRLNFEGKEHYFCSNACKQKFLASKKPH